MELTSVFINLIHPRTVSMGVRSGEPPGPKDKMYFFRQVNCCAVLMKDLVIITHGEGTWSRGIPSATSSHSQRCFLFLFYFVALQAFFKSLTDRKWVKRKGKTCSKGQHAGAQTRCDEDCSLRTQIMHFNLQPLLCPASRGLTPMHNLNHH
ncbi:hypothetical protein CHARACLAT_027649 [Characodon lateralis]|uniref:Uncharacterized protein n=1 Tax=Characodon lateralis TaxID=208331 RepID=A0ABU7F7A1_9TELE|nr:hypothetical protein [Characodon lateralis]